MINVWKNNKKVTENPAEHWQQRLWQALNISSKDDRKQELIKVLGANQALIRKHFPEISFFGLSIYTRFHLEFFDALSEFTQVNFYLCLSAELAEPGNELFNSMGTKAKELIKQFEPLQWDVIPADRNSLLGQLQNLIHYNQQTKSKFSHDESIQINSCYTPVREVESLYNYLLDLFVRDRTLRPRDVLVMATDINKYAPFIKAVSGDRCCQ
jgi:exodeoxyribonuclease V gamma subunit